jgi:CheY-like chemotaxis protein
VNLPAVCNPETTQPIAPVAAGNARRGRVLVMDDEASIRLMTINMLRHLGIEAEVVSNGSAAVERYRRARSKGQPFGAVLLDLMVPGGMGAREAMEQLTEIDPDVNAIAISGSSQDHMMTAFKDYGFKAAIGKPFSLKELSNTLNSILTTDIPTERTWTVH